MITFSQAYKLCDCDGAYLRPKGTGSIHRTWLSDKKIRNCLDMRSIKVTRISPQIDMSDGEYMGMEFEVVGITAKELWMVSLK